MIPPYRSLPVTGGWPEGGCLTGALEAEDDRAGAADCCGYPPGGRGDRGSWFRDACAYRCGKQQGGDADGGAQLGGGVDDSRSGASRGDRDAGAQPGRGDRGQADACAAGRAVTMTVTPRTSTNCTRHSDTTPSHTVPALRAFTTAGCRSPTGSPAPAMPRALPRHRRHSHHPTARPGRARYVPDGVGPRGDSRSLVAKRAKMAQISVSAGKPRITDETSQADCDRAETRAVTPIRRTGPMPAAAKTLMLITRPSAVASTSSA